MTSFGELYEQHYPITFRMVYAKVRDHATAEDLTADVFLKALRGFDRYEDRGVGSFRAWVHQIALFAVIDHYRAGALRQHEDIEEYHHLGDGVSLEDEQVRRDLVHRIWHLVEEFPPRQRTAMILYFQEDMSQAEVAREMGTTERAVKILIHRGLVGLRRHGV